MKTHAPIHPGEVLREDFLIPLGLSEYRVAKDIGVPPDTVIFTIKNKKIQPQMNRMNADKQSEKAVFICVLHLRSSGFICG